MTASIGLFLRENDIDGRWKVVDIKGFPFGDGETKTEAIKSARNICDTFIRIAPRQIVSKPTYTTEELIETLADITGMMVIEVFDENLNHVGYDMELRE